MTGLDGIALADGLDRIFAFHAIAGYAASLAISLLVLAIDAGYGIIAIAISRIGIGTFRRFGTNTVDTDFVRVASSIFIVVIDACFDGIARTAGLVGTGAIDAFPIIALQTTA